MPSLDVENRRGAPTSPVKAPTGGAERKEGAVKYVILIWTNPGAFDELPKGELDAIMAEFDAQTKQLEASGELVGGAALGPPAEGRTVRVRGGVPAVTDGPFVEAKEALAGYFVVDTETLERAVEIASADPNARLGAVEVRAIVDEA
jgi:hypothetical protein